MKHRHFAFVILLCILLLLAACNRTAADPNALTQEGVALTAEPGETTIPDVTFATEAQTTEESGTTRVAQKVKLSMFSYLRQRLSFSMNASVTKVMNAIKARDIAALEAMMCLNIKQNIEDLPGEIGELIDAIDGKITEYTWSRGGGTEMSDRDGRLMDQDDSGIKFETTGGVYGLHITWEVANNYAPEETGIRVISLWRQVLVEYQGEVYKKSEELAAIKAPEGLSSWHD